MGSSVVSLRAKHAHMQAHTGTLNTHTHTHTEHTHTHTHAHTHAKHTCTHTAHTYIHTPAPSLVCPLYPIQPGRYENPRSLPSGHMPASLGGGVVFSQPLCPTPGDPSPFHPRFLSELVQHLLHLSLEGPKFKGATRPQNNSISGTRTI